jgi:hypothetical protein
MPLSFPLESLYNGNGEDYGYCATCKELRRFRGHFHGENRAEARGRLAITPSCPEASNITLANCHLIS